ncbi:MAG TPA: hypothetical protein VFR21_25200 [Bradyrhizobium sp.]|jgi:hypothetical protein|nr:hypothetical protein [Bradyrhizobium sp.]
MWTFVKQLLAKSRTLNQALGDVAFETPQIKGASSDSFLQWRVKKSVKGEQYFFALKMRPDTYAGPEGSPTSYMSFDIETAKILRSNLDRCISEYYRMTDVTCVGHA